MEFASLRMIYIFSICIRYTNVYTFYYILRSFFEFGEKNVNIIFIYQTILLKKLFLRQIVLNSFIFSLKSI